MSKITNLHDAVKHGDLNSIKALLDGNRDLANSRSETDARGTYPLHVAAEFGQADAARVLLSYGADASLLDSEGNLLTLEEPRVPQMNYPAAEHSDEDLS